MKDLQKAGGIASLIEAVTVVVGLGMFATLLTDYTTGDPSAAESVAYVSDNQAILYIWNTITLIVFAVFLVVVSLALHDRLKSAGAITQAATVFGFIWSGLLLAGGMVTNIGLGAVADLSAANSANAESVWLALDAVQSGLSGGNEITGGVWILLLSWAGLRTGALPSAFNYLGIVMGVAALATIVPALEVVGALFGLGLIVWFIWLGMIMLRDTTSVPA